MIVAVALGVVALYTRYALDAEVARRLGTDRLLDMARTTLNVAADVVTACIVDEQLPPPPAT